VEGPAVPAAVPVRAAVTRMSRPEALRDDIGRRARDLGFSLMGVTDVRAPGHMDFYRSWLDAGYHGEMAYLAGEAAVARRADLGETMPEARSCIVVAHAYDVDDDSTAVADPSRGVVARYARGADYHRVVKRKLEELLTWLDRRVEGGVRGRAYVDTGPILERELASRAGLGWFGRNTMLIHPKKGSYFFLGVLLVDLQLAPDAAFAADHCGTCRACLDACPTGALLGRDEHGSPVMDARRCISYLTIELRGPIPRELRPFIGNRVFGCDVCQEVCPFTQKFSSPSAEPRYAARGPGQAPPGVQPLADDAVHPGTAFPPLIELMSMDAASWESFSRGSPIRRAGRAGFLRNVAVAIGNWLDGSQSPEPRAVTALAAALSDPEALVRGHAAWALGRAGSPAARDALLARLVAERDAFVRGEIGEALSRPPAASIPEGNGPDPGVG
jgi:epoxyqueuosine reductase